MRTIVMQNYAYTNNFPVHLELYAATFRIGYFCMENILLEKPHS